MFDIEKARQAEELAAQCLSDLCHARRRWEMHIPLQSDDPDVLLGDALGQLRGAIKEVEQQRQRAEAAEAALAAVPRQAIDALFRQQFGSYPVWFNEMWTPIADWLGYKPARA